MKLSFTLQSIRPKLGTTPSLKPPAAFSSLDDDEPVGTASALSDSRNAAVNKKLLAQNVESSTARKRMEAEKKVDHTVYEYDEVWDKMQEAKQRQKEAKDADAKERKPKYIHGLLASAATRNMDHLRAEEKMIQHEREREGDEFADKEAFVTQAYKDQMAEVRRAEEQERQREELEKRKKGGAPTGMAYFYQKLLEESEQKHEETVAATTQSVPTIIGPQGPKLNLTITKPPDFTPKSDLELARAAREEGKSVELNDDNQIVDKRELLTAGLNLSAPNTRRLGTGTSARKSTGTDEIAPVHRAVGIAATRKEINERRAREIQQQLQQEEERLAKEREREDQEAMQRIVAKRNTQEDVQSARERYFQRKRRKLEENKTVAAPDP